MLATRTLVLAVLALALSVLGGLGGRDAAAQTGFATPEDFFAAEVQPNLGFCRNCHVPGGVADGRRFLLSSDPAEDYAKVHEAWVALGEGVEDNWLLRKPSDPSLSHTGGKPWPVGGQAYQAMRTLLTCFVNPDGCLDGVGGGGGGGGEEWPLLGNPGKHFFVNQLCDDALDENTPIDWGQDPRRMLLPKAGLIDSEQYAVHFNDPFEICRTDILFKTQERQNEIRGGKPIYSAKRSPATCREWRAAVKAGHDWVAMWPTSQPLHGSHGQGNQLARMVTGGATAKAWNDLWKLWGMSGRPDHFDDHLFERYGHSPPPDDIYNRYPLPGEEALLSETFGGSGRLPLGWAQGRNASGVYNGTLGLTCLSCHGGRIGAGEISGRDGLGSSASYGANPYGSFMGVPNTNTELGVLLADLLHVGNLPDTPFPAFGYIPLVNTTRGTNAADTEIEAIVMFRDFDTLEFSHALTDPLHGNMGDQDPPAWWWLHNKTRYLWFGGHSSDSARGNMYFGSVNALSGAEVKENEGRFEDVHQWTLSIEAPDYPYPGLIDTRLAEQGAIVFHEKDLWADGGNDDIPRPKGKGSCAGCHGAYSPRYIHDQRFLPDPKLAGMVGYTVPIEIVDTDPAQAEGWVQELREHVSTFWWSYPDAVEGYRLPEEKDPSAELVDDYAVTGASGADLADHLKRSTKRSGAIQPLGDGLSTVTDAALGPLPALPAESFGRVKGACGFEEKTVGYVAPPLHGVWASAPYFHNGSVPTVRGVLDPFGQDEFGRPFRPKVWRRQRTTTPVHFHAFETRLTGPSGGYDFEKLGWQHDVIACDDGGMGFPYYSCQPAGDMPDELRWFADISRGGLLWPMWMVPPPIGDQGLADRMVFNTNMYSKSNRGHEWTKVLSEVERRALIEYLKTL